MNPDQTDRIVNQPSLELEYEFITEDIQTVMSGLTELHDSILNLEKRILAFTPKLSLGLSTFQEDQINNNQYAALGLSTLAEKIKSLICASDDLCANPWED